MCVYCFVSSFQRVVLVLVLDYERVSFNASQISLFDLVTSRHIASISQICATRRYCTILRGMCNIDKKFSTAAVVARAEMEGWKQK